jgi:fumarylpyruvate hydrolase
MQNSYNLFYEINSAAVVQSRRDNPFPPATENLHHEVELVVVLKTGGTDITTDDALSHVMATPSATT